MTEEQHIQKGFNAGYQLQKHNPDLAKQMQKGFSFQEHPYAKAFASGRKEYVKEQSNEKANMMDDYSKRIQRQYKQKRNSKEKGKSPDKGLDI